jgi:CheY-like chemotaxis protein
MKILIVDPDGTRAPQLKLALATNGAEVTVAPSGSFALTMLEWNRHDVIVSRARLDDMDGHELCAILRSDPGMRDVRFVLVAGNDDVTTAQTMAAGIDLLLPPTLSATAMVPLVLRVAGGESATTPTPAAPLHAAAASPVTAAPSPFTRSSLPVGIPAATGTPSAAVPTPAAAPAAPAAPPAPLVAAPPPPAAPPVPTIAPARPAPPAEPALPPPLALPPSTPAAEAGPELGVPKLKPATAAAPVADPPKRYVTAAAAAAAAPWTKATAVTTPASTPPPPPPINLDAMPSGTFQGSLEVMDLAELTQAIAMGGKKGRLILALPQGGGVVAFEGGQVVHAEYRGTVGEAAFAALLTAAHADAAGRFCFLPAAPGEKVSPGRTIDKTVDRLLLSIATAIDEKG